MNQSFCRALTTTVLVCATGIPFAANAAEEVDQLSSLELPQEEVEALPEHNNSESDLTFQPDFSPSQDWDLANFSDVVEIVPHSHNGKEAATLSVNAIPVLTFVGASAESSTVLEVSQESSEPLSEAATRSLEIARRLDEFHQAASDPNTILVKWDAEIEEYVITLNGESLVVVDEATVFSESTGNVAEDALFATNRLRYLMGAEEALTEIEGQPEPEAPAQDSLTVASVSTGQASWYGPGFNGRRTASGEVFNQNDLTAAHRTLPFGTLVRVTNLNNGRQVIVRINDRGPFSHGRIIDLSAGAARTIGLDRSGVGPIRLEVLAN